MVISEIFHSIQGEGRLTGMPSTFIRTTGCNLRCRWCDTPETSWRPTGVEMSLDRILDAVRAHPARFVVLTGGEPMIAPEVGALTRRLNEAGFHVTIETAGTVFEDVCCDLASVSPKLRNSTPDPAEHSDWSGRHEDRRINASVIQRIIDTFDYQLKFVVDRPEDVGEVEDIVSRLNNVRADRVLLMPQGVEAATLHEKEEWITQACMERGWRFCPRLHIQIFGHAAGT